MGINKRTIRISILVAAVIVTVYFIWSVRSGLYPFIIALFLAYLLNPAVCYLENKGLRRTAAILALYILVFSAMIFVGARGIPLIIRELENFGRELPFMVAKGEELIQFVQSQYQNSVLPYSLRVAIDNALLAVQNDIQQFIADVVNALIGLVSHSIGLVITPILAFYLLHDWYEIKEKLLQMIPMRWHTECILTFREIDKVLSGVIRGQLTVALIVGILVTIGLEILGVRYALLIGIVAGILDIIPYFGAFIGATPAVTLALLSSPWLALKVVLLFFAIHQLEGSIIGPQIMGDNVGLHPLSVIFFLFIGGELGGIPGMLLGVPIAAVGKVFIRHMIRMLI